MIFGSSGHKARPHGGVLVNYRMCLPSDQLENNHVKVIANTRHLLTVGDDPHTAFYRDKGKFTVNELGAQVRGAKTEVPSHTKIALYHYLTKSEAEFVAKIKRGSAAGNYKNMGFFAVRGRARWGGPQRLHAPSGEWRGQRGGTACAPASLPSICFSHLQGVPTPPLSPPSHPLPPAPLPPPPTPRRRRLRSWPTLRAPTQSR